MIDQSHLVATIHLSVTEYILEHYNVTDEWEINCGDCENWAMEMIDRLQKHGIHAYEQWLDDLDLKFEDTSHCVLVIGERYYDSQHPYGVDDPAQLDVVRQIPRIEALKRLDKRRFGLDIF